ncbi:MAG: 5'-3' exonuclease H3TH domain-containing protein [Candidatus Azotimanducaceae bacterium WSBS_2022_MAG_OTU7]
MSIRFLAVDGFNLIRRIYEALIHKEKHQPESSEVSKEDMIQVIEAAKSSLARALKAHQPTHAAVAMEHHDQTWRHLLYPAYKANRSETPPMLLSNLPQIVAAFADLGVQSVGIDSYEADDVIATLATVVSVHQGEVVILSTDKIYLQLVNDKVIVYDHFANKRCDSNYLEERYDIGQNQYIDYLALVGDKSNNIKGVQGIGPKSAVVMLSEHDSLEQILSAEPTSTMLKKVHASSADALRSKQLVTLKTDVELGQNLKSFRL